MSHTSIIYRVSSTDGPIRQCEIFSNLVHLIPRTEDPLTIDQITKPYVILVTQDCDLHNDYLARHDHYTDDLKRKAQLLPFLTFIELLPIGEIYSKYGISSSLAKKVKTNQHDRYQYFRIVSAGEDSMCEGMPEFVCDFRRSFSVPTDYIYRELSIGRLLRRSVIISPYIEHVSTRFAHYIARVALPEPHNVEQMIEGEKNDKENRNDSLWL